MKLWEYSGKRTKITAIDGQVFSGLADLYTSELDNPSGVESLCVWVDDSEKLIEFELSEIVNIEIIAADDPIMAKAI